MVAGPDVPAAGNTRGNTTVGAAGFVNVVSWKTNGAPARPQIDWHHVVVEAVAAANHGAFAAERTIGKPEPRCDVVLVGVDQRPRRQPEAARRHDVDVARRHQRRDLVERAVGNDDVAGGDVEEGQVVAALEPAGMELVAEAEVDGQIAGELPVVLHKRSRKRSAAQSAAAGGNARDAVFGRPSRKSAYACPVYRPVKSTAPKRLDGCGEILPVGPAEFEPALHRVRAAQPRHLIRELFDAVEKARDCSRRPATGR